MVEGNFEEAHLRSEEVYWGERLDYMGREADRVISAEVAIAAAQPTLLMATRARLSTWWERQTPQQRYMWVSTAIGVAATVASKIEERRRSY